MFVVEEKINRKKESLQLSDAIDWFLAIDACLA